MRLYETSNPEERLNLVTGDRNGAMRTRRSVAGSLAASAFALAGCGSGGGTSSRPTAGAGLPGPLRIYRVPLSGASDVPPGAPAGSGAAVIAFHGKATVCWRFAHLHGFTLATSASLYSGAGGTHGRVVLSLSPGPLLHHQGCVRLSSTLMSAIEQAPQNYYVSIRSRRYPRGAVRGQI
jgi:hypothetical protein